MTGRRAFSVPPESAAGWLAALREAFEGGDAFALIEAIGYCAEERIVMPEWVVLGYRKAIDTWQENLPNTLDEALGVAWPKGKHIAAAKKRHKKQFQVYFAIVTTRVASPERRIDDIAGEVGERFGIGRKLALENYYGVLRIISGRGR